MNGSVPAVCKQVATEARSNPYSPVAAEMKIRFDMMPRTDCTHHAPYLIEFLMVVLSQQLRQVPTRGKMSGRSPTVSPERRRSASLAGCGRGGRLPRPTTVSPFTFYLSAGDAKTESVCHEASALVCRAGSSLPTRYATPRQHRRNIMPAVSRLHVILVVVFHVVALLVPF